MQFPTFVRPLGSGGAVAAMSAALLAGCTHYTEPPRGAQAADPTIDFAVSPCFGFCPDFSITLAPSGEGTYEGNRFVKTEGRATFTVTPQEYAAFRERLAPFRPEQSVRYDYEHCDGPVATDHPSVSVRWTDAVGEARELDWYLGCRQPELTENSDAIYQAWQELPAVAELVGTDEERRPR